MALLKKPISEESKKEWEEIEAEMLKVDNQVCRRFCENIKWRLKLYAQSCKKAVSKYIRDGGDPSDNASMWLIHPPKPKDFGIEGIDINFLDLEALGLSEEEATCTRICLDIPFYFEALEALRKLSDSAENCSCSKHGCSNLNGSNLCSIDGGLHEDARKCPYYDPVEQTCENCNGQNDCPPERLMAVKMGFHCEHWRSRSN